MKYFCYAYVNCARKEYGITRAPYSCPIIDILNILRADGFDGLYPLLYLTVLR